MAWSRLERIRLALPAIRLAWRYFDDGDAWRSLPHDVPMAVYGSGNLVDDFQRYLEGPSRTSVASVRELAAWLRKCKYEHDAVLFGRPDYWQHPVGFEELRRGDCEDHALWAWRKLIELGHEAELVIGRCRLEDEHPANLDEWHAWVVYADRGERWLLEATEKSRRRMIRPLAEASVDYWPHASVDHRLQRRLYAGFIRWLDAERQRRKDRRAAQRVGAVERPVCG